MSQKKCPSCNAMSPANSKFCSECGSPLSKKAAEKSKPVKSNTTRDTLIIVGVLAIAAIAYFVINKPVPVPKPPQQSQQPTNPAHQDIEGMNALANLPTDYNTLVQIGIQTMDEGNYPMAAECYKRALAINSESVNVRTDYGACLHGMGLPDRAIEEFMTVLRTHPEHTIANFNLGIVYYSVNNIDSAKAYFNKYLSLETSGPTYEAAKKYLSEINK